MIQKKQNRSISVVMAVYNGVDRLEETLTSILNQEEVDFEFIVVNDGSTDGTLSLLRLYADNDSRLRIISQENMGLTRSLIRGCAEAKGEYIARQDAGDISLSGRLKKESDFLASHPEVLLVSCGTRFVGPQGEYIYEVIQPEDEAREGLGHDTLAEIRGPSHHGSTMFRRSDYKKSGGYRAQFKVAQDLDLWTRLNERGEHAALQDILYIADLSPGAISHSHRISQIKTAEIILECVQTRQKGGDESQLLNSAELIDLVPVEENLRFKNANFLYFIGSCIAAESREKAHSYFSQSLRQNPFHIKALYRYIKTVF